MALKRSADVVKQRLVVKSGSVLTKGRCRIHVPIRWMSTVGLGSITETTTVYGFFPIIFDDNIYGVLNACALMDITPSRTTTITVSEEEYYEFLFEEGDQLIKSNKLVRTDTLTFNVMNEFIMKGKVPWWTTLDDLCSIFDTADKHAGSKIASVPQTIEFMAGVCTRSIQARAKVLRQSAKSWKDYDLDQIDFVALPSVLDSVTNTVAKLSGAHFQEGVVSALVNPSTKTSKVESILRA